MSITSNTLKLPRVLLGVLVAVGLLLGVATRVRAEVTGTVEMVGFDQSFRPGVWTPLVVQLTPGAGDSGTYQLQVEQEDLDRDLVTFSRTVTLTAGASGPGSTQRFTTYFLPQGTRNNDGIGLPDATQGSRKDQLETQLKVYLCDASGKRLSKLQISPMIASLDPLDSKVHRGRKLILYVTDGSSRPAIRDLSPLNGDLMGVTEDLAVVGIALRDLPSGALAYSAVDAVIWAAGGPPDRSIASEEPRYRALREWLGAGGKLVVMQHPEWRRTAAWGELLPVTFPRFGDLQGTAARTDLTTLTNIVGLFDSLDEQRAWRLLSGPHNYGLTAARPGAVVEEFADWTPALPGGVTKTPWLARFPVGAGCVTYVAQDLGSPLLSPANPPAGWAAIWCRVLDYKYRPTVVVKDTADTLKKQLDPGRAAHELGQIVLARMELTSRVGALIGVSVIFFLLYWLTAGPGTWVLLKLKGRADLGWAAFAVVAAVATLVTLVVVRVVLRGSPELRHFTLVRTAPGEPALVESRIGLYIPRDGDRQISLPAGSPDYASAIGPYALHPYHARDVDQFPSFRKYAVPSRDTAGDSPVSVEIPFRSTAKRLQTTWRGELNISLNGKAAIAAPSASQALLAGTLTNDSGQDLRNVFLVFRSERSPNAGQDRVVFVPAWKNGDPLLLDEASSQRRRLGFDTGKGDQSRYGFESGVPVWDLIGRPGSDTDLDLWFRSAYRPRNLMLSDEPADDSAQPTPRGYVFLSLFDRMPFYFNRQDITRAETLRINARFLDVSAAVSAGRLVILAQSDNQPLPTPLSVDGTPVTGKGTTLYQFVLPLDRTNDIDPDTDNSTTDSPAPTTSPEDTPPTFPTPRPPK